MTLKFVFFTVCICLSVPGWALDREESPAETAYNQAYDQWELGLVHFLTEQESPIIRVLGSWRLDTMSSRYPDLDGEGQKVRAKALANGWSDPAIILSVYGTDCTRGKSRYDCNLVDTKTQLLKLDPANAAVVLLPWLFPGEKSPKQLQLNAENVSMLVEAAKKQSFDLYLTAGFYDARLAIGQYVAQRSPPQMPEELLAELDERGFQLPSDPLWAPGLSILSSAFASRGGATFSTLVRFCGLAESEGHSEAIRACLDLADLMQRHAKSSLAESMGYALRKRIERPGYIGANKENLDPERWRDRLRSLEFNCARPRLIHGGNPGQMPASHWSQYLQDMQESGELVANRQAAEREYAMFPEAYEMDPSDCSRIHELDEETQRLLASEQEIEELHDVLQALEGM